MTPVRRRPLPIGWRIYKWDGTFFRWTGDDIVRERAKPLLEIGYGHMLANLDMRHLWKSPKHMIVATLGQPRLQLRARFPLHSASFGSPEWKFTGGGFFRD